MGSFLSGPPGKNPCWASVHPGQVGEAWQRGPMAHCPGTLPSAQCQAHSAAEPILKNQRVGSPGTGWTLAGHRDRARRREGATCLVRRSKDFSWEPLLL